MIRGNPLQVVSNRVRTRAGIWTGVAAAALLVIASSPKGIEYNTYETLKRGKADGVSITSDGVLLLSPQTKKVAEVADPFVWTAVADGDGNLYLGTGNDGKIYRVTSKGDSSVYFKAGEPEIHALVFGPDGALYAGSSPDGKVYRITAADKGDAFYTPGEKYIWALAFEKGGSLLVGTGEKGKLFRVNHDGKGDLVFDSGQPHVRCIALGRKGEIYLGTSDDGIIYRIDSSGAPFAVYDSAFQEIVALIPGDGGVYAAGGSAAPRAKPPGGNGPGGMDIQGLAQSLMQGGAGSGGDGGDSGDLGSLAAGLAQQMMGGAPGGPGGPPPGGKKAGVLWVTNDGIATSLWDSQENVFSAIADGDSILVGTGDNGKLYRVYKDGKSTLLADLKEKQITALARNQDRTVALTSNLAAAFQLDGTFQSSGTYTSEVYDAQSLSDWGAVDLEAASPAGITISTRAGNTKNPEKTWSGWQKVALDHVVSPPARFLQWKAEFSGPGSSTPRLNDLSFAYLQRNLPPVVQSLSISEPGVAAKPGQPQPAMGGGSDSFDYQAAMSAAMQSMGVGGGDSDFSYGGDSAPPPPTPQPRPPMQKGYRTVTWRATDPNKDRLKYSLYYRGTAETNWKLLKDNLMTPMYNWDTTTIPDGTYVLKLVASDAPSNPEPLAKTGEKVSDDFVVDNTPPVVSAFKGDADRSHLRVSFTVTDAFSVIDDAQYSIDGGEWKAILPIDGIPDSKTENYSFSTDKLSDGEHTIMVKVTDDENNVAYASITVTL